MWCTGACVAITLRCGKQDELAPIQGVHEFWRQALCERAGPGLRLSREARQGQRTEPKCCFLESARRLKSLPRNKIGADPSQAGLYSLAGERSTCVDALRLEAPRMPLRALTNTHVSRSCYTTTVHIVTPTTDDRSGHHRAASSPNGLQCEVGLVFAVRSAQICYARAASEQAGRVAADDAPT